MSLIPSFFGNRRGNSIFSDPFSLDVWDPFKDVPFPELSRENSAFVNTRVDWKETPEAHVFKADLPGLKEDIECLAWLDKQGPNSIIYVSIGSLASINEGELVETAWGLANSEQPFLWVVRPGSIPQSDWMDLLPESFKKATEERGCIVEWAPQKEVLGHDAVGGFWSHCGWNSTLESICAGVPMICQPCFGDQRLNARFLSHIWRVGIELDNDLERGKIERSVRKLMLSKEGEEMRQRATELKIKVELSIQAGGSSYDSINNLVEYLSSL